MYSPYHSQQKGIPGYVAVLVVMVFVVGLGLVLKESAPKQRTITTSKETPSNQAVLGRFDVVDVRDKAFSVYWRTDKPTKGYIVYGYSPDALDTEVYDSFDLNATPNPRRNHFVKVRPLKSDSTIYYRIIVDGEEVEQAQDVPFQVSTMRTLTTASSDNIVVGKVLQGETIAPENTIVIMNISTALPVATRVENDGSFVLSQCCLYSSSSGEPYTPNDGDVVQLEVIQEDGTHKKLSYVYGDVVKDDIKISMNSDDREVNSLTDTTRTTKEDASKESVLAAADSFVEIKPVDLIYPRDGSSIPGLQPLVRGVGEPGAIVRGRFVEQGRIFQVKINEDRLWTYTPSYNFKPGEHHLIVDTTDEFGRNVTLSSTFTILKSGEAVLGEATDSATLTPTASPSESNTPTPQEALSSTPTPTSALGTPTPTPTPPQTGINILPLTVLSVILIVVGAGFILLF